MDEEESAPSWRQQEELEQQEWEESCCAAEGQRNLENEDVKSVSGNSSGNDGAR